MEQLISVIPYVKELTGITDEARKVVEQQVAEFALSIKTSKLDREQLEAFFKKPYYLEPVHGRPDSWHLVIPKFVDIQIGWLERSTESFNVFLINRYMDWLGEIPEAIKRQLNWNSLTMTESGSAGSDFLWFLDMQAMTPCDTQSTLSRWLKEVG